MPRKPPSHTSLAAALQATAEAYRRSRWHEVDVYVEVWCESDSVAGVLYQETAAWDVPLLAARGYSSISFLHGSAQHIQAVGKPAYLYYFGDYDPSSLDITRQVEDGIREFAPDVEVHFERIAVTPEQIEDWRLPTKPAKPSDSRSKQFRGETVEIEAIPATALRSLVRDCITQHIDQAELDDILEVEHLERDALRQLAAYCGNPDRGESA